MFEGNEGVFSALKLKNNEHGIITMTGHSMEPDIHNGDRCLVYPRNQGFRPRVGDIVFCKIGGNYYLRKIVSVKGLRVHIGDNRGKTYGSVSVNDIYGTFAKVIK